MTWKGASASGVLSRAALTARSRPPRPKQWSPCMCVMNSFLSLAASMPAASTYTTHASRFSSAVAACLTRIIKNKDHHMNGTGRRHWQLSVELVLSIRVHVRVFTDVTLEQPNAARASGQSSRERLALVVSFSLKPIDAFLGRSWGPTCLQEPSPASTRKVAWGRRSEMQETFRLRVGAPDDVPSQVTAMPVLAAT